MLCYRFSFYRNGHPHGPIRHMYFEKLSSVKKLITDHHVHEFVCIVEYGDWSNAECDDDFV